MIRRKSYVKNRVRCTAGIIKWHTHSVPTNTCLAAAISVAEGLGVALPAELDEVAADIADGCGMKVLERKRFLKQ